MLQQDLQCKLQFILHCRSAVRAGLERPGLHSKLSHYIVEKSTVDTCTAPPTTSVPFSFARPTASLQAALLISRTDRSIPLFRA